MRHSLILFLSIPIACDENLEIQSYGALEKCERACPEIDKTLPVIAFPGEIVVAQGRNLQRMERLYIGKVAVDFERTSNQEISFIMPEGQPGLEDLSLITEVETIESSTILRGDSKYPIITGSADLICSDVEFYNSKGEIIQGERDCTTNIDWLKPNQIKEGITIAGVIGKVGYCNAEGQQHCIAKGDFRPAKTEGLEKILLEGYEIAGIEGKVKLPKPEDVLAGIQYGPNVAPIKGQLKIPEPNEVLFEQEEYGPNKSWIASVHYCTNEQRTNCVPKDSYFSAIACEEEQTQNCYLPPLSSYQDVSKRKVAIDFDLFDGGKALTSFSLNVGETTYSGQITDFQTLDLLEGEFKGPGIYEYVMPASFLDSLRSQTAFLGQAGKIGNCADSIQSDCFVENDPSSQEVFFAAKPCEKSGDSNCYIKPLGELLAASKESVKASNIVSGYTISGVSGQIQDQLSPCAEYQLYSQNETPRSSCVVSEINTQLFAAKPCVDDPETKVTSCIIEQFQPELGNTLKAEKYTDIVDATRDLSNGGSLLASLTIAGLTGQIPVMESLDLKSDFPGNAYYKKIIGIEEISSVLLDSVAISKQSGGITTCATTRTNCYATANMSVGIACASGDNACITLSNSIEGKKYLAIPPSTLKAEKILDGHSIANIQGTQPDYGNTVCSNNQQENCLTNSEFPAMKISNQEIYNDFDTTDLLSAATFHFWTREGELVSKNGDPDLLASNLKSGISIFNVAGAYPSEEYPIAVGSTDLTGNLNATIATASNFNFYDSSGTKYQASGDTDLSPENLRFGINLDFDFNENTMIIGQYGIPSPKNLQMSGFLAPSSPESGSDDRIALSWDAIDNVTRYKIELETFEPGVSASSTSIIINTEQPDGNTEVSGGTSGISSIRYVFANLDLKSTSRYQARVYGMISGNLSVSPAVTEIAPFSCPDDKWIAIGTDTEYHSGNICIMKYEASKELAELNGQTIEKPVSQPAEPWTDISKNDAIAACDSLNDLESSEGTYSLLTNEEWMAIAKNVSLVPSNWVSNYVGGFPIKTGNIDGSAFIAAASNNDNEPCANTSFDCEASSKYERTYNVHNGSVLWDLSGNVDEMVTTEKNLPNYTGDNADFDMQLGNFYKKDLIPSAFFYEPWASHLGGSAEGTGTTLLRGGSYESKPIEGLFTAYLNYANSGAQKVGFRCVYRPQR